MKNYNEIADSLFERRDEYNKAKERRKKTAKKAVLAVSCLCLAVLLGFGVRQSGLFRAVTTEPTDGEGETVAKYTALISSFDYVSDVKYPAPANGQVSLTIPLGKAIEKYGDTAKYNVKISITRAARAEEPNTVDVKGELKRLSALGYTEIHETYSDIKSNYYGFSCHATKQQLLSFPASEEYGYFIELYDEGQTQYK